MRNIFNAKSCTCSFKVIKNVISRVVILVNKIFQLLILINCTNLLFLNNLYTYCPYFDCFCKKFTISSLTLQRKNSIVLLCYF